MEELINYLNKIGKLNYISAILRWEMDTTSPAKSQDYLIGVSSEVQMKNFKLSTSEDFINLLNKIDTDKLDYVDSTYINTLKEDYHRFKRVPESFYNEYIVLKDKSLNSWVKAKKENNYNIFKPYLMEIINKTKELYKYMYPESDNLYDSMLSTYEKRINTELIDKLFTDLKKEIIPIIKNLKKKSITKINKKYTDEELKKISSYLLDYIGFDNSRGALGIYTHGYTMKMNNNDVRIAFSNESNIIDHISTTINEGGHGIFEQNISEEINKYDSYDKNDFKILSKQYVF